MNDTIEPHIPYLVQRIELASAIRGRNGKKRKIDYRDIKCVHGGIPAEYDRKAVNDSEASQAMRSKFMSYAYMGSSEFEWGAIPQAYWRFLRAFEKGEGTIQAVELSTGVEGESEKFRIFAPKSTVEIAKAFLKLVSYSIYTKGTAYLGLKETLGFDQALFPTAKRLDGEYRSSYRLDARKKNELDEIGWFDLNNCYFIFWDRSDIAQAFSNLHDFGDIHPLETEVINFRKDFANGKIPERREYFKPFIHE